MEDKPLVPTGVFEDMLDVRLHNAMDRSTEDRFDEFDGMFKTGRFPNGIPAWTRFEKSYTPRPEKDDPMASSSGVRGYRQGSAWRYTEDEIALLHGVNTDQFARHGLTSPDPKRATAVHEKPFLQTLFAAHKEAATARYLEYRQRAKKAEEAFNDMSVKINKPGFAFESPDPPDVNQSAQFKDWLDAKRTITNYNEMRLLSFERLLSLYMYELFTAPDDDQKQLFYAYQYDMTGTQPVWGKDNQHVWGPAQKSALERWEFGMGQIRRKERDRESQEVVTFSWLLKSFWDVMRRSPMIYPKARAGGEDGDEDEDDAVAKRYFRKLEIMEATIADLEKRAENPMTSHTERTGAKIALEESRKTYKAMCVQPFDFEGYCKKAAAALKGLKELGGNLKLKNFVLVLVEGFLQNGTRQFGQYQNFTLEGPSGVGKTTWAKAVAKIYGSMGMLLYSDIVQTDATAFIAEYKNQSGPLTKQKILSSLEKVLFIDEAYAVAGNYDERSGGWTSKDAIDTIVSQLDQIRGLQVMIAAGYRKDMSEQFFGVNSGMLRRFAVRFKLPKYAHSELMDILEKGFLKTKKAAWHWSTRVCFEIALDELEQLAREQAEVTPDPDLTYKKMAEDERDDKEEQDEKKMRDHPAGAALDNLVGKQAGAMEVVANFVSMYMGRPEARPPERRHYAKQDAAALLKDLDPRRIEYRPFVQEGRPLGAYELMRSGGFFYTYTPDMVAVITGIIQDKSVTRELKARINGEKVKDGAHKKIFDALYTAPLKMYKMFRDDNEKDGYVQSITRTVAGAAGDGFASDDDEVEDEEEKDEDERETKQKAFRNFYYRKRKEAKDFEASRAAATRGLPGDLARVEREEEEAKQ